MTRQQLAQVLETSLPEVCFALLHGSAKDGSVRQDGDIDLALYLEGKPSLELYERVNTETEQLISGPTCDIGILNRAEPVYRFEALKGRLLFCRDQETYLRFYSLACREYESQMASYQRQQSYRQSSHG